jgi:excisionase family DNA binding protein
MLSTQMEVKPLLYRREIAAMRLGVSLRTLDELLARKELASVKVGKRRLISEDAIQSFVKKREKR